MCHGPLACKAYPLEPASALGALSCWFGFGVASGPRYPATPGPPLAKTRQLKPRGAISCLLRMQMRVPAVF
eukprot:4061913-Amphidinium_carterae.1